MAVAVSQWYRTKAVLNSSCGRDRWGGRSPYMQRPVVPVAYTGVGGGELGVDNGVDPAVSGPNRWGYIVVGSCAQETSGSPA